MANKKKLLKGFKNVYFAQKTAEGFSTPVRIDNAVSIEAGLNYETEAEWADDVLVDDEFSFAGGEGKLSVKGLTKLEFSTLFASKIVKGGIVVNSTDISPEGAFLFERGRKSSNEKRLYVIYACKCSPASINAEGVEAGKGSAGVDEINFLISSLENGDIYHFVDTDDETIEPTTKSKWFTQVQIPTLIESASQDTKKITEK